MPTMQQQAAAYRAKSPEQATADKARQALSQRVVAAGGVPTQARLNAITTKTAAAKAAAPVVIAPPAEVAPDPAAEAPVKTPRPEMRFAVATPHNPDNKASTPASTPREWRTQHVADDDKGVARVADGNRFPGSSDRWQRNHPDPSPKARQNANHNARFNRTHTPDPAIKAWHEGARAAMETARAAYGVANPRPARKTPTT